MNQIATHRPGTAAIPETLDSPRSKLVFLYLQAVERSSIDEVSDDLDMTRLCVLPLIDKLVEAGLVRRHGDEIVVTG